MKAFFEFEKFLTPSFVKLVYWAGLIAIAVGTMMPIFVLSSGTTSDVPLLLIGAIASFVVGSILWRVVCEIIILLFRIYERMTEIRDRLPPA